MVVEGQLTYCDVEKYAANGLCVLESKPGVHNQLSSAWDEEFGIWKTARNAWYQVEWKGHVLDCLILTWTAGFQDQRFLWVIADDLATAEGFFSEVSAWNAEIRDEVLVFDGGCWSKSDALFRDPDGHLREPRAGRHAQGRDRRGPDAVLRRAGDVRTPRRSLEARGAFRRASGQRQDARGQGADQRDRQALPVRQELPGRAYDRA